MSCGLLVSNIKDTKILLNSYSFEKPHDLTTFSWLHQLVAPATTGDDVFTQGIWHPIRPSPEQSLLLCTQPLLLFMLVARPLHTFDLKL